LKVKTGVNAHRLEQIDKTRQSTVDRSMAFTLTARVASKDASVSP
jgi:hypothetical protein